MPPRSTMHVGGGIAESAVKRAVTVVTHVGVAWQKAEGSPEGTGQLMVADAHRPEKTAPPREPLSTAADCISFYIFERTMRACAHFISSARSQKP